MPISFLGMQSIMQHLSFEKRLDLIQKAPATRAAHRSAPLKLNHLMMSKTKIRINKANYSVGVITHYPESPAPKWAVILNSRGGSIKDIVEEEIDPAPSDLETANNYEREARLKEILSSFACLPNQQVEEVEDLRKKIQKYYEKLAVSKLKKVHYIQFTTTSLSKTLYKNQKIERVCYGLSLENANVYLFENLLGFGSKKIYVKHVLKIRSGLSWPGCNMVHFAGNQLSLEDGNITSAFFQGQQFNKLQDVKFVGEKKIPIGFRFKVGETEMEETMRKVLEWMPEITQNVMQQIARKDFPLILNAELANIFLSIEINKAEHGNTEQLYSFDLSGQKRIEKRVGRAEQDDLMDVLHLDPPNRAPHGWQRNIGERNARRRGRIIRR